MQPKNAGERESTMDNYWKIFVIFMFVRAFFGIINGIRKTPRKKLEAIQRAQDMGCYTTAKVSCYTLTGSVKHFVHNFEYVYKVGEELYYLTYELDPSMIDTTSKKRLINKGYFARFFKQDIINEQELLRIGSPITVYYNSAKPKKALTKQEVFIAPWALKRKKTDKKNAYRDVSSDWYYPVDLRTPAKGGN